MFCQISNILYISLNGIPAMVLKLGTDPVLENACFEIQKDFQDTINQSIWNNKILFK